MLGLWMWATPTVNILGQSSDIGSLSLPLPSVLCLSEPRHGAIAELRWIYSALLKPEVLLSVGSFCSHPSTRWPNLPSLCLHRGTHSLLVPTVIFDTSHMAVVTSPLSVPACGRSGLLYILSNQSKSVWLIDEGERGCSFVFINSQILSLCGFIFA